MRLPSSRAQLGFLRRQAFFTVYCTQLSSNVASKDEQEPLKEPFEIRTNALWLAQVNGGSALWRGLAGLLLARTGQLKKAARQKKSEERRGREEQNEPTASQRNKNEEE